MYEHADQSWRSQPRLMSESVRRRLAERIGEHVRDAGLTRLVVVFHGGEPLLAGAARIAETARWIRAAMPSKTEVDFSIQTNGTLLDEKVLRELASEGVSVSLSIDGPRRANDRHRLDHRGRSSFEKTLSALELLERHSEAYGGLIAVIDPAVTPEELFEFFAPRNPPRVDFLLPDANHERLPPQRQKNSGLYKAWLLRAFDLWFDHYPDLPVRMFDAVLNGVAGISSDTDAFGFGDVSLVTVETDGSYHDLDVLKITAQGATALGLDLESHSIAEAASSAQMEAHRRLLCLEGLSIKCQSCAEVEVCGGGSVPHRYSREGFANPTVYCEEMLSLIRHARRRVGAALYEESVSVQPEVARERFSIDLDAWNRPEQSEAVTLNLVENWAKEARSNFDTALDHAVQQDETLRSAIIRIRAAKAQALDRLVTQPAVCMWTSVMTHAARGVAMRNIDGEVISPDPSYVTALAELLSLPEAYPRVHRDDRWLRLPFGRRIYFEEGEEARVGAAVTLRALEIIEQWRPALVREIRALNPDIQFIRDLDAHPDKAVSFSDNSTPGALYVAVWVGGRSIDPYLLADSIIHEHRHQKLYLLQREVRLLEVDAPLVNSPWRDDPRPPSGLFHAVFVFANLYEYWEHLAARGPSLEVRVRASSELELIRNRLEAAVLILRSTRLTNRGSQLVDHLEKTFRK